MNSDLHAPCDDRHPHYLDQSGWQWQSHPIQRYSSPVVWTGFLSWSGRWPSSVGSRNHIILTQKRLQQTVTDLIQLLHSSNQQNYIHASHFIIILVHALIEYKSIQTCSLIRHNKNSLIKLIITFSYQTIYMYIFQVNTLVLQLKEQKTVYKIKLTLLSRSSAAKTWLKSSRASFCWLHRK